ncbi:hypothetical protein SAMD00023353_0103660 [Rosellinia necatrix]|uniref:Uncharacterized protein n=1 Tax=Rosellinia necatrix TaxID=77044 RepID=A0A1S8A4R7_ROSNE|nr:hypothetical protein SAMD00023353_0103660 [Rosellinia necatrix]
MCRYRKTLYQCNHARLSPSPHTVCSTAAAGEGEGARCEVVATHACLTVRAARPCDACAARQAALDRTFAEVRGRLASLRRHLDDAYGGCMRAVDEAGLGDEDGEGKGEMTVTTRVGGRGEGDEKQTVVAMVRGVEGQKQQQDPPADPVEAFLRMKRAEKHSHLMMLG